MSRTKDTKLNQYFQKTYDVLQGGMKGNLHVGRQIPQDKAMDEVLEGNQSIVKCQHTEISGQQ